MALRFIAAAPLLTLLVSSAQQPVPPSVRYEAHVFAGGSPPPAGTLDNPVRGDAKSAEQGGKLFTAFNCDGCHAVGAVGGQGPSLADGRWRYGGGDDEIFHSIYYGRPRGMPAFGGILPPEAIWQLVTYLQSLEPKQDAPTVSW
ncbi:MAG TPA: cytochrome c [Gemmatimonadales bacterium]|nr:cytochrome c [Gemmatimonadales bacterium]